MKHTEHETKQARWLTAILKNLGNQIRDQDRESIAQNTVKIMSNSLGFEQITLYLVPRNSPTDPQIVAQTQAGTDVQVFPSALDWKRLIEIQRQNCCRLIPAPGTKAGLSEPGQPVQWRDNDRIYAPLVDAVGLLGYVALAAPHDGLRPTQDLLQVIEIMAGQTAMALRNAERYANVDRALDERLVELATLQEIDRQINAKLDMDHVMQTMLDWAMHTTCALSGTISLLEPTEAPVVANPGSEQATWTAAVHAPPSAPHPAQGQHVLRVIAHRGYSTEMAKHWHIPWSTDSGLAGQVMQTGETAVSNNVPHDTDYIDPTVSPCSHLITPIKRENRVVGLICLESTVPNGFTEDHVALLTCMADRAAIAIENAQLYEQTNRRITELESLRNTCLELTSSLDLEGVLDSIVAHSQALAGADHIALFLYDERQERLCLKRELSSSVKRDPSPVPTSPNQIAQEVAREGKARVAYNAQQMSTIASIPLIKANCLLGVLNVSFQKPNTLTRANLRTLHLLADSVAIAIDNAQLYAKMEHIQEAQNEFISAASHEFKVPVTSIQGYAKLIALPVSGPITEQQKAYLDVIQKNIQRIHALVDDLMDYSNNGSKPTLHRVGNTG